MTSKVERGDRKNKSYKNKGHQPYMAKGHTHYCLLVLEAARGQVKINDVPNCIYYFMYFTIKYLI